MVTIASAYAKVHLQELEPDCCISDLLRAKIFPEADGNFTFMYSHYAYYSVARYIRDHIEGEGKEELRAPPEPA
jgi:hypothetical protein